MDRMTKLNRAKFKWKSRFTFNQIWKTQWRWKRGGWVLNWSFTLKVRSGWFSIMDGEAGQLTRWKTCVKKKSLPSLSSSFLSSTKRSEVSEWVGCNQIEVELSALWCSSTEASKKVGASNSKLNKRIAKNLKTILFLRYTNDRICSKVYNNIAIVQRDEKRNWRQSIAVNSLKVILSGLVSLPFILCSSACWFCSC